MSKEIKSQGYLIDPPEGQCYGFAKWSKVIYENNRQLHAWLVRNGYPRERIKFYGESFYVQITELRIPD